MPSGITCNGKQALINSLSPLNERELFLNSLLIALPTYTGASVVLSVELAISPVGISSLFTGLIVNKANPLEVYNCRQKTLV